MPAAGMVRWWAPAAAGLVVASAALGLAAAAVGTATAAGPWAQTGPMLVPRSFFTLTTIVPRGALPVCGVACGKVLATGGDFSNVSAQSTTPTAELYDPAAGGWAPTAPMATARSGHSAVELDDGEVLVEGGDSNPVIGPDGRYHPGLASAEIYSPVTGTWRPTGSLTTARYNQTSTLLAGAPCGGANPPTWCGDVLVVGGQNTTIGDPLTGISVEQYDHRAGRWTVPGQPSSARWGHTATALPDGRVLVAGGSPAHNVTLRSAEIYDPATRSWKPTGDMAEARMAAVAAPLPDGRVLVAGGGNSGAGTLDSAEVFDPATGEWTSAGRMTRPLHQLMGAALPSGKVLVLGENGAQATMYGEIFEPATGGWKGDDSLVPAGYGGGLAATLPEACGPTDRAALVSGGISPDGMKSRSAWLYAPAPRISGILPATGPLAGGTPVTLAGVNLKGVTAVSFGDIPAQGFTIDSDTQVRAISPGAARAGPVNVTATSSDGSSSACPGNLFNYTAIPDTNGGGSVRVTAISPTCSPLAGGISVTVTGDGFVPGRTRAAIGTSPAALSGPMSTTSFVMVVPQVASPGRLLVTVTTPDAASSGPSFLYSDSCAAQITSLGTTPTSATIRGPGGSGTTGGFQASAFGPGSGGAMVVGGPPTPVPPGTAPGHVPASGPVPGTAPMSATAGMPSGAMAPRPRETEPESAAEHVHGMSRVAAAPAMVLAVALGAVLAVVAACLVADGRQRFACSRPRIAWARSS